MKTKLNFNLNQLQYEPSLTAKQWWLKTPRVPFDLAGDKMYGLYSSKVDAFAIFFTSIAIILDIGLTGRWVIKDLSSSDIWWGPGLLVGDIIVTWYIIYSAYRYNITYAENIKKYAEISGLQRTDETLTGPGEVLKQEADIKFNKTILNLLYLILFLIAGTKTFIYLDASPDTAIIFYTTISSYFLIAFFHTKYTTEVFTIWRFKSLLKKEKQAIENAVNVRNPGAIEHKLYGGELRLISAYKPDKKSIVPQTFQFEISTNNNTGHQLVKIGNDYYFYKYGVIEDDHLQFFVNHQKSVDVQHQKFLGMFLFDLQFESLNVNNPMGRIIPEKLDEYIRAGKVPEHHAALIEDELIAQN
jgi:hypothetical protein